MSVHPEEAMEHRKQWHRDVELLDEELEPSGEQAVSAYAARVQREAEELLDSKKDRWQLVQGEFQHGLRIYARPTRGSQLVIVRAEIEVLAEPDPLFLLLTSKDGLRLLDPATTQAKNKAHTRLDWHDRAEIVLEDAAMSPGFAPRTFVACNLFDHSKRLFNSKSILQTDLPPGADGTVRACKTVALRTQPGSKRASQQPSALLELLSWVDMRGSDVPPDAANHFATEQQIQEFVARLFAALPGDQPKLERDGCCCMF